MRAVLTAMLRARVLFASVLALCTAFWIAPAFALDWKSPPPPEPLARIDTYRVTDANGSRTLVIVRAENRIEVRTSGGPIRVWRRTADGIELRELDLAQGTMVVHAPRNLRAAHQVQNWARLNATPTIPGAQIIRIKTTEAGIRKAFTPTEGLRVLENIENNEDSD